jgi:hypothetical protein
MVFSRPSTSDDSERISRDGMIAFFERCFMGKVRLVTLALLVSLAYIAFEHIRGIMDLYRAAYPDDRVKREALEQCALGIKNFSRLDAADRDRCYAIFSDRLGVVADNPSHPSVNDVRRQEAFDGYRAAQGAAAVSMVPPPNRAPKQ